MDWLQSDWGKKKGTDKPTSPGNHWPIITRSRIVIILAPTQSVASEAWEYWRRSSTAMALLRRILDENTH